MEKASSKHRDTWYNADGSLFDEDEDIWVTDKYVAMISREAAEAALEYFNSQDGGKKYELVEHGPTMAINPPMMNHLNFMAKEKDCPSAPLETFFAQLSFAPYMKVDCCVSLGPSRDVPHWCEAEFGGCTYCPGIINHPTKGIDNFAFNKFPLERVRSI